MVLSLLFIVVITKPIYKDGAAFSCDKLEISFSQRINIMKTHVFVIHSDQFFIQNSKSLAYVVNFQMNRKFFLF